MPTVAIIGAGDLAGAVAHALAAHDRVAQVLLIDAAASAAAGKALDIQQMGSIDRFHTRLAGTDDMSRLVGCAACVVAGSFGKDSHEWSGEQARPMLRQLAQWLGEVPLVFAGATQGDLLRHAVVDIRLPPRRMVGSAPDAFAAAVRAIVALEARCSPREVALGVLGSLGRFVVPWSEATVGGYALERTLSPVQLARVDARVPRLWPPGTYALGLAAARVVEAMLDSSRQARNVVTVVGDDVLPGVDFVRGRKNCLAVVPALLSPRGIIETRVPSLSTRERVLVDSALGPS